MQWTSTLLVVAFATKLSFAAIDWHGNWAFGCDFPGQDFQNVQIKGEDCGGRCFSTPRCTHFTWVGGTCWMKDGACSKAKAVDKNGDKSIVCGVIRCSGEARSAARVLLAKDTPTKFPLHSGREISSRIQHPYHPMSAYESSHVSGRTSTHRFSHPARTGIQLDGVLATRHGATESGACELPAGDYAVTYPVALGDIESLGYLKFKPELCGLVLRADCGNGPLDIIVTNSNYGGGLDLYGSTWDKLTNGAPPGQAYCSVDITDRNAFNGFDQPQCFYKPDSDFDNPYYRNLGLFNTNGKRVTGSTVNGQGGSHRGDNPFFATDFGPVDGGAQVHFSLDDGNSVDVTLDQCRKEPQKQMWS